MKRLFHAYIFMVQKAVLSLLLIGCFTIQLLSQSPEIRFKQISVDQGLSNSWIEAIGQGARGFMWIGTRDGLNRYDGKEIKIYRNSPADPTSISDNFIHCIYLDRDKRLWVGTANGLNSYEAATDKFTRYKHIPSITGSISNSNITNMYEDTKGNLWICTNGGGLNLFNRKQKIFTSFRHSTTNGSTIASDIVNYVMEDVKGNLWVATEAGLNLFNRQGNTFALYTNNLDNSKNANVTRFIVEDSIGNLVIGTANSGVIIFNPVQKTFRQLKHEVSNTAGLSGDIVYSMLKTRKGDIWVGIVNEGLNLFNQATNSFTHYRHEPSVAGSLAQRTASAIFEDMQGNLWVGTHRGGVNLYAPGADKFKLYHENGNGKGLSYSDVKCFCEDRNGLIWIGTDGGGVNVYNRKQDSFTYYTYNSSNPGSLASDAVLDIAQDKAGNMWVSTWGGGLNLFNPTTQSFTHFVNNPDDKTSISSNFVQKTFQDSEGNIWVGTYYGGLNLLDPKTRTFTRIVKDSSGTTRFLGNNVVAINEDKQGNIWFGTDDGGLNSYNLKTKHFTNYFNTLEKSPDFRVIFTDSKGRVWAGQAGLYLLDAATNTFSIFPGAAGFPGEFIKGVTEDGDGNLWVSTSKRLAKVNLATKVVSSFNTTDGLQGSEFESNAFLKTQDGEMFFGGNAGMNSFYPRNIKVNTYVPPVFITGFQIFNKKVTPASGDSVLKADISVTKDITLNYRQSSISFDFAALNYVTVENNQYAYMLEGLDTGWTYTGNINKASFTNLSPRKYVFHVKASNNDGIWNEKGTAITITVTPPFWATWWFRALIVLIIIACAYGYYSTRMAAIKRQKAELEKQVKERTAEVTHKAEELQEMNEELQVQQEEMQVQSEELSLQAAHLMELNEQLERQKESELEKAVAQNKFEIASEVLHDVGNAVVGFSAHVNQVNRALEQDSFSNMQNLALFLKKQQAVIATAIGPEKAGALVVLADGITASQKGSKEDIRKSVTELFNIISHIEEILTIQRQYVKNQTGLHIRKAVNLTDVINDCRAMLSATLEKKGIELTVDIEPGRYVIKGDQTKLMQVILNVLKNSMEAIDMASDNKKIDIYLQNGGNIIRLSVTDTGSGFDEETGAHLFHRGFTTKQSGTGLGLYNCKSIVESHDGVFVLESDGKGLGARNIITFTI